MLESRVAPSRGGGGTEMPLKRMEPMNDSWVLDDHDEVTIRRVSDDCGQRQMRLVTVRHEHDWANPGQVLKKK